MNRFIAEKVMGFRWFPYYEGEYTVMGPNPDYTGPDKAALMDFAVEQEWWEDFKEFTFSKAVKAGMYDDLIVYLWRNLARLIAEYHGWREAK